MAYATSHNRQRLPGALAAGLVEVSLAVLIVTGLAGHYRDAPVQDETTLVAFDEKTPPPNKPPPPPPAHKAPREAGGAPPAPKAAPREAPVPKLAIAKPRPAASKPGEGQAAAAGSAQAGSGFGAGGSGNGAGAASGSGDGGGIATPAIRVAGGLSDRDYPRSAAARGAAGTVAISFRVRTDGRVDGCSVIGSSGDGELDSLTCALVERRFLYRPALTAAGQPRDTTLRTTFTWGVRGR